MESLFEIDSSFFKISKLDGMDISSDVLEFSIIEEIGKIGQGTISIYDPDDIYAKSLKSGIKFMASWGYKKFNSVGLAAKKSDNPIEFNNTVRPSMTCIITSPSGTGDASGILTYSANFMSYEFYQNGKQDKVYKNLNKQSVVIQSLKDLGITTSVVNFKEMSKTLDDNTYVRQQENTYKFLVRLAYEWRCFFYVGTNAAGQLAAIFVDNTQLGTNLVNGYLTGITGAVGTNKKFEYGIQSTNPNVISYFWQFNIGNSGQGDATQLNMMVNGEVIATSYIAESQTVTTLKLNENRLKKFLETHVDDFATITSDLIKAQTLDGSIKGKAIRSFFDVTESKTAPQGLGYSANLEMIGDPNLTPLMEVKFGHGFPSQLITENPLNKFYIKKVTHKINASGYRCSVEIADVLTIFESFVH